MKLILSLLAFLCLASFSKASKFSVQIYFESLCGDTRKFFLNQAIPFLADEAVLKTIDLQLVPYGKANTTYQPSTGAPIFTCQHGQPECEGNIIYSCLIKYVASQVKQLQFLKCSFQASDWYWNSTIIYKRCSEDLLDGDERNQFESCPEGDGPYLLDAMGNKTHSLSPALNYVPWINFNGVRNKQAEFNFAPNLFKEYVVFEKNNTNNSNAAPHLSSLFALLFSLIFRVITRIYQCNPVC